MHRRWPKLRFDVENREENVVKHVHSPSGDVQIIFLIESMQTAIHCDRSITAQLQSADSEIRMISENSEMISFRKLVEQQCNDG